ncbi:permease [Saccharomonospora piscinae]|uniref:Permease n=1 Tax=Saccharomonospora piscinae TaxID=687388 RepID=A0A1V9A130_SACPI|nr:ABC transporter permease [Saccharomonospora piscinae]OQO90644.1 permease [Saccharomonospora piscinae]
MIALRLAWRVLRTDRRTRTSAILMGVGVAVATGLMLLLVSLPGAAQSRMDRGGWQVAFEIPDNPDDQSMLIAASEGFVDGELVNRVDVAALGDGSAIALPPGVERFPAPGEVLLSPALRDLVAERPGSSLGERYPGTVVGTLGADALTHPGQLVALVGHTAEELPGASPVAGFAPPGSVEDPMLDLLAGVGVVVLLVPSLVLVSSAARLTAARRERRLAALRLAGATPRQVVAMVAGENTVAAVAGALLGWAASPALHLAASTVSWQGGTWHVGDFATPLPLALTVVVAIPLLVLLAAVFGVWRVVRTPLGAANAHRPRRPHWARLLSLPAALGLFVVALEEPGLLGGLGLVLALALVIGSSVLLGPWVTAAVGSLFSRIWRGPAVLLAGRRLRHDPKGAYRSSAGVVLAVFTGSMALTLLPSLASTAGSASPFRDPVLYVQAGQDAPEVAERTNAALERYGLDVEAEVLPEVSIETSGWQGSALVADCETAGRLLSVTMAVSCADAPGLSSEDTVDLDGATVAPGAGEDGGPKKPLPSDLPVHQLTTEDSGLRVPTVLHPDVLPEAVVPEYGTVAVPTTPQNAEQVRTALAASANGLSIESVATQLADQQSQLDDLRRVTVIGLVVATLLSGCSAAITAAGSVMDRRRTFGSLMAAGTPVRVLGRALRTEAAMPALVATVGAGAVGVFIGTALFQAVTGAETIIISPWALAPVVLGIGTAVIAASVCTPALRRVAAEPLSDE